MNVSRAALLALSLSLAPFASADDVHLTNGGLVRGKARREGDVVVVELEHGTLRFEASKVARIETCPSPAELEAEAEARRARALEDRITAATPSGSAALFEVVQWAIAEAYPEAQVEAVRGRAEALLAAERRQALQERIAAATPRGSAGLAEVARWAIAAGYPEADVAEVRASVGAALAIERRKAFDERMAATDRHDADALWETALWARQAGQPEEAVRMVLELVIGLAPDHAAAREALGQALHGGRWLPADEVRRLVAAEKAEAMRRDGFVWFGGAWMRADEARWQDALDRMADRERRAIDEAESAEAESRRLRDEAARVRAAADDAERRHQEEVARLDREQRDAEAATARRYDEQVARLERERREAAADAARRLAEVEEECRRRLQAMDSQADAEVERLRRALEATRACLAASERLRRDACSEAERAADRVSDAACELGHSQPDLDRVRCLLSEADSILERVAELCRRAVD